jgi:hypothetical protein
MICGPLRNNFEAQAGRLLDDRDLRPTIGDPSLFAFFEGAALDVRT